MRWSELKSYISSTNVNKIVYVFSHEVDKHYFIVVVVILKKKLRRRKKKIFKNHVYVQEYNVQTINNMMMGFLSLTLLK